LIHQAWLRQRRALARARDYRRQLEREVAYRTQQLAERNAALLRVNSKLEEVSFSDPLTGLGNRRSLAHAMPALIAGIQRNSRRDADGSRLALLIVDLDHLKPINDEHGHEAGDRLLTEVAVILNQCVRATDKVVRWGGDEFVVVHTVRDLDGAAALAERIRYSVSKRHFRIGGEADGRTSCSIGFALYPFTPGTLSRWEKVLSVADANLYRAKETRNAWVGCCGRPNGTGVPDLESLAERDLAMVEGNRYVDVRRSDPTDGETVELFLRRPISARTRK
jgi:diguanylate cyclase (GGDEF)-like protein